MNEAKKMERDDNKARELINKYDLVIIHENGENGEKSITPKQITESIKKEFPQDREELIRLKPVIIPILEQSKSKTKCMECDREARNFVRQTDANGKEKIIMALCNYHYTFIPVVDPDNEICPVGYHMVEGYRRRDGTFVKGHCARDPDHRRNKF